MTVTSTLGGNCTTFDVGGLSPDDPVTLYCAREGHCQYQFFKLGRDGSVESHEELEIRSIPARPAVVGSERPPERWWS
jgi:hypothetical protein